MNKILNGFPRKPTVTAGHEDKRASVKGVVFYLVRNAKKIKLYMLYYVHHRVIM